jgi:hypothetical protein
MNESVIDMTKFTIKCLFVAAVFFFGVLLGIQEAHIGTREMKGADHQPRIEQSSDHTTANVGIEEKRERLEHINTFNVFSAVGNAASQTVTGLFRSGVDATSSIIEKFLT